MQIRKIALDAVPQCCSTTDYEAHEVPQQSLRVSTVIQIEGISYLVEAIPSVGLAFPRQYTSNVAE